ncbi:MAG: DUF3592 domain-containing protein [Steroidobacteraceae bacterium]
MFQLVFSALSAINQLAVFAGGLVCWGLGGLLLGNAIYWRLHAVRVQGEVVGVRRNGNCFNSVYRYTSAAGATIEATSLEGSSSVRGRETGRRVPLWVIPEKPDQVQETSSHVFTLVGLVLLGVGVVFFWVAVRSWRTGPMTWIMAAVFGLHLLARLRKVIAPRDKTLPPSGWRALAALRQAARTANAAPSQPIEELTALPEFRDRQIKQQAQLARMAPFLLLAGLALLAFGVYTSRMLLSLETSGIRAPGSVISLSSSSSSNGGTSYYPVVRYRDGAGRSVTFRDSTGTNPPLYHVGEAVTVLYLPSAPGRAIIDRGPWNWLPSLILFVLGGATSLGALAARRARGDEPAFATQS